MPVAIENPRGAADILLVCEHASHWIPPEFDGLGLSDEARTSHIAWDPGALGVALELSRRLDAVLVHGRVSRLVYDLNRPPEAPTAMPAQSEIFEIPGNAGLDDAQRQDRAERFYWPFRHALAAELDRRHKPAVLVTVHSFTPVFHGQTRTVEIGVLDGHDGRLADALFERLPATPYELRRNEPYGPQDGVAHTLLEHGVKRGILNVMLEIRNDRIATTAAQASMAEFLASPIEAAIRALN